MKKLILFLALSTTLFAQEKIDLGTLKGGGYQVLMPAKWNKKLVMLSPSSRDPYIHEVKKRSKEHRINKTFPSFSQLAQHNTELRYED